MENVVELEMLNPAWDVFSRIRMECIESGDFDRWLARMDEVYGEGAGE